MRKYELVIVLKSSLKDLERKKILDTVKEWMKGIKIGKENDWGQKPLSYAIRKEISGHYLQWLFEGDIVIPTDFEKRLLREDGVLRHLLLRTK